MGFPYSYHHRPNASYARRSSVISSIIISESSSAQATVGVRVWGPSRLSLHSAPLRLKVSCRPDFAFFQTGLAAPAVTSRTLDRPLRLHGLHSNIIPQ